MTCIFARLAPTAQEDSPVHGRLTSALGHDPPQCVAGNHQVTVWVVDLGELAISFDLK
jgi:hypothetical protein